MKNFGKKILKYVIFALVIFVASVILVNYFKYKTIAFNNIKVFRRILGCTGTQTIQSQRKLIVFAGIIAGTARGDNFEYAAGKLPEICALRRDGGTGRIQLRGGLSVAFLQELRTFQQLVVG